MGSTDNFIVDDSIGLTGPDVKSITPDAASLQRKLAFRPSIGLHPAQSTRQKTWTMAEVSALMDSAYPAVGGQPGDHAQRQQRLCLAFLAGAAQTHGGLRQWPEADFISTSVQTARTLLKNRAMGQACRLSHAFMAGVRAAEAGSRPAPSVCQLNQPGMDIEIAPLRLFIRQPFTESDQAEQGLVAAVLAQLAEHSGKPCPFNFLTGTKAERADSFRASFEAESGQAFTPPAFRAYRLNLLDQADVFINIRVGMSESSAFELCYHIFKGTCAPVLFLVWKQAPIKTTLLRELQDQCDITYLEFEHADDLRTGIEEFFCERNREAQARFAFGLGSAGGTNPSGSSSQV